MRDIATCVQCGCTDTKACLVGCSWLAVNRGDGTGVCSSCGPALKQWRAQQASKSAIRADTGTRDLLHIGPTDI